MSRRKAQRNREMIALRENGLITKEIAIIFNVSPQRVRQIIGKSGTRAAWLARRRKLGQTVRGMIKKGMSAHEIAAKLNISDRKVYTSVDKVRFAHNGDSKRATGARWEEWVSTRLAEHGIENQLMPNNHPYDILALRKVRIDVKSSNYLANNAPSQIRLTHDTYAFNIRAIQKRRDMIDIVILIVSPAGVAFVIPVDFLPKKSETIRIPYPPTSRKKSKYHSFCNAWELCLKSCL